MGRIECSANILFCLLVVVCGMGTAQASFLDSQDAAAVPRPRIACHPSPTAGTHYPDPFHLGPHAYGYNFRERGGIVYTCRGGHIDITHVRKAADWTAYLAHKTREALLNNTARFTYRMREPSRYHVQIEYPNGWISLAPEMREEIASDMAISLGQYLAYTCTTWHEMLTWFGFKSTGLYSEYPSAFSWEDSYSNLLGSCLAVRALRDPDCEYSEAMTQLIDRELQKLGVQSKETAREAGEAVRDWWFVSAFIFVDMIKRNFDIGSDDGFVAPWVVPGIGACDGQTPEPYPAPDLAFLDEYGFSVKFEIEPREWEKGRILRIICPDPEDRKDRIEPAKHFGPIIESIRAQAIQRYGPHVEEHGASSTGPPRPHMPRTDEKQGLNSETGGSGRAAAPPIANICLEAQPVRSEPARPEGMIGDVNGDRRRNPWDLVILAACWLAEETS